MQTDQETFDFRAEAVQVLDLVINSLYSNKEIFLRELISNASDAIDRLRLEMLSNGTVPGDSPAGGPPRIRIGYDQDAGTITIADNGIGMSRQEVIEHIGTIAKSGTREFLRSLTGDQRRDATLIGQFGVGFYSAFIVAERVTLLTRRYGTDEGTRWESDGKGAYTLTAADVPSPGTTIVLQLRDTEDDLLDSRRLRTIIARYSDHISVPIRLQDEDQPVNQAAALWTRPKAEISDQDYRAFYRHTADDFTDPLAWMHSKVEGTYEYTLLLFIPARAPYDLWVQQSGRGVKLHIRRVFVMADNGQLLPSYLRFVRGVIDSSDLPLNVSRELLQSNRVVDHIRTNAVKKVLRLLADLAENEPDRYAEFWTEFGAALKEGMAEDFHNRDEIARLLRFPSTRAAGNVSLGDYVERMAEGQEHIYYLVAPSLATAAASPHLEAFKRSGIEVLLLGEDVDNWVVSNLREFDGKRLQSAAQGGADLGQLLGPAGDAAGPAETPPGSDLAELLEKLKSVLAGQAYDVRLSSRLTTSPSCIVAGEQDINPVARLRSYGLPAQPVLEINPVHPLVRRLAANTGDPRLADWAHVLYNQAVLTLGAPVENPAAFVTQLNDLLVALTSEPGQ
ncbi:MAG TPA: molecular chaperone HtpG [Trebonia sp.]